MNSKAIEKIKIRLLRVDEKKFKSDLDEATIDALNDNLKINLGYSLMSDKEARSIVVEIAAKYTLSKRELFFLQASLLFEIQEFDEIFDFNDNKILEKVTVIPTLLNISIGALRGMIAIKASSTLLKNFPLPLIDPNSLLKQANTQ